MHDDVQLTTPRTVEFAKEDRLMVTKRKIIVNDWDRDRLRGQY
jgi:hypothetical protein